MSDPEPSESHRRSIPTRLWAVPLVLVLAAAAGVTIFFQSSFFDPVDCAATVACGEGDVCCEGDHGPVEPEDPAAVQFTDATDLTAGAAAFTATDGYLALAAPGVWVPDLEREGWTPIPDGELVDAQFGFTSGDVRVDCYGPGERPVLIVDTDVFSAIAVAQRARNDEASVYERTGAPEFGHYRVDGRAVLAAEAEYTWTTRVDPDTGEITEGEWNERWGFVAVYLGDSSAAICSYGGPADAEPLDDVQDHLLGVRFAG
ncbi:hypothetical protein [Glycomyces rhizosphaerae]|uniref:Uncharacterized protein n=1 Tax=Glycomyces rhizosphaerae TaxID=2054422 RepID=A0ABV7PV79_9ACTN